MSLAITRAMAVKVLSSIGDDSSLKLTDVREDLIAQFASTDVNVRAALAAEGIKASGKAGLFSRDDSGDLRAGNAGPALERLIRNIDAAEGLGNPGGTDNGGLGLGLGLVLAAAYLVSRL